MLSYNIQYRTLDRCPPAEEISMHVKNQQDLTKAMFEATELRQKEGARTKRTYHNPERFGGWFRRAGQRSTFCAGRGGREGSARARERSYFI